MTTEQILELGKMGYTKADIEAMAGPKAEQPAPKQEVKKETPSTPVQPDFSSFPSAQPDFSSFPSAQPETEPAPASNADAMSEAITKAFAAQIQKMEELSNRMATLAGMPSIADAKPVDISDVISKFFE